MKGKHHLMPAILLGLAFSAALACQGGGSAAPAFQDLEYLSPADGEFVTIGRTLVQHNVTGCGEYYVNTRASGSAPEYAVKCSADGVTWLYWRVWPDDRVLGPFTGSSRADAEELAWPDIQAVKSDLDASRARLAEAQAPAEPAAAVEAVAGEAAAGEGGAGEGAVADAEVAAPVDTAALEKEMQDKADAFNQKLVAFINEDPITEGEEPTPTQRAALDMYIEENMGIAREFIEKGGDYRQAIDRYQQLLQLDPDNAALQKALADAEANRYMTAERFAQVEEGMTEEQVRAAIGPVNLRNIQEYEDGAKIGWFYTREEGRGYAAGVYFERRDDGTYTVIATDFDAATPEKTQQAQEE